MEGKQSTEAHFYQSRTKSNMLNFCIKTGSLPYAKLYFAVSNTSFKRIPSIQSMLQPEVYKSFVSLFKDLKTDVKLLKKRDSI